MNLQKAATSNADWKAKMINDYGTELQALWDITNKGKPLDLDQVAILADGVNAISKNKTVLPTEIQTVLPKL